MLLSLQPAEDPERIDFASVFFARAGAVTALAVAVMWAVVRAHRTRWAVARLAEQLGDLAAGEPLPPLPTTGWEETAIMATALGTDPDAFVLRILPLNPALAARCVAAPDVRVTTTTSRACLSSGIASATVSAVSVLPFQAMAIVSPRCGPIAVGTIKAA